MKGEQGLLLSLSNISDVFLAEGPVPSTSWASRRVGSRHHIKAGCGSLYLIMQSS